MCQYIAKPLSDFNIRNTKNTIYNLISHSVDLDGYGSMATILEFLFQNNVSHYQINIIPINYNTYSFNSVLQRGQYINSHKHNIVTFITDFSLPIEEFDELYKRSNTVFWVDHHSGRSKLIKQIVKKYYYEDHNKKLFLRFNLTGRNSAVQLIYNLLFKTLPPFLIKIISDGDLYKWNYPISKSVLQLLRLVDWRNLEALRQLLFHHNFFGFSEFKEFLLSNNKYKNQNLAVQNNDKILTTFLYEIGSLLYLNRTNLINQILKSMLVTGYYKSYKCGIINCTHGELISDLGNKISEKVNGIGIVYSDKLPFNQRVFSLRCRPEININVAKIAEEYNGSGHEFAASFSLPIDKGVEFVNSIIDSNINNKKS